MATNSKIKYTYNGESAVKDDGFSLPTKGTLMADDLKGEVQLALNTRTIDTNGTYGPQTGYDGYSQVVVNVSTTGGVTWEQKTVTPSESAQTIVPEGGATPSYGLSQVTVSAITATYVGSGVTRQSEGNVQKSISVKTGDLDNVVATVTIPAGYYASPVTVSQEIDVLPSPTTPAATAAYILAGYHAYDGEGVELEGTMPNSGSNDLSIPSSDADGNITIPAGYYDGEGEVQTAAGTVKSGVATVADPSFVTDHFEQTVSVAAPSVETAGWVSSSKGTKQGNSGTTKSLAQVKVGVTPSKTSMALDPAITRTEKPSGDGWLDAADGAGVTTKPTSGVYVQVNRAAASDSATATGKVSTAGYGDTTHFTPDAATTVNASVAAATLYVPIRTTSIGNPTTTSTISGPTAPTVPVTATTVAVPSGATVVRYTFIADSSYKQSAQGYVTDTNAHAGNTSIQTVDIPVFQLQ